MNLVQKLLKEKKALYVAQDKVRHAEIDLLKEKTDRLEAFLRKLGLDEIVRNQVGINAKVGKVKVTFHSRIGMRGQLMVDCYVDIKAGDYVHWHSETIDEAQMTYSMRKFVESVADLHGSLRRACHEK